LVVGIADDHPYPVSIVLEACHTYSMASLEVRRGIRLLGVHARDAGFASMKVVFSCPWRTTLRSQF